MVLFLFLIDRQKILTVVIAFLLAFILFGTLDEIGTYFNLWEYPHQLIFFTARFNAVDFGTVPCMAALLYQFCSKWKNFMIGNLLVSVLIAFVGAPIVAKMGIYKILQWNFFYSFIVTFLIILLLKAIVDFIVKKQMKYA
jgi:hypothetical protein